jgi:hypothetical protein
MKGTDCTPEQLRHARRFLVDRGWNSAVEKAIITTEDLIRIVAWYGALRYQAAATGEGGSLNQPGELVTAEQREP